MTTIAKYAEEHHLTVEETDRLKALDLDGDGTIDEDEVMASAVQRGKSEQKIVRLELGLAFLGFFFMLMVVSIFGLSVLAVRLSKDTTVSGADLENVNGELLNVNQKIVVVSLYDYIGFTVNELSTVRQIAFSDGIVDNLMQVSRVLKIAGSTTAVTFYSPGNDRLVVTADQLVWQVQGQAEQTIPRVKEETETVAANPNLRSDSTSDTADHRLRMSQQLIQKQQQNQRYNAIQRTNSGFMSGSNPGQLPECRP
jgi:hypothetical protein